MKTLLFCWTLLVAVKERIKSSFFLVTLRPNHLNATAKLAGFKLTAVACAMACVLAPAITNSLLGPL